MESRLDRIKDWSEIARSVAYSAQRLARCLNISDRQLRRYFKSHYGETPHRYLDRLRLGEASRALAEGGSVKEVAFRLRFKQPSHFSKKFKLSFGWSPSCHPSAGTKELGNMRSAEQTSGMGTRCPV